VTNALQEFLAFAAAKNIKKAAGKGFCCGFLAPRYLTIANHCGGFLDEKPLEISGESFAVVFFHRKNSTVWLLEFDFASAKSRRKHP
jgi:hypothetical protein